MAQSGYTPILIYASGTASNVPLAANMTSSASGAELALNYADGKLYYKNSSGVVTLLANSSTVAPVTTFSAGTTGLTPSTATSGAVTLAGTLVVGNGGTGLTSLTAGQIPYGNGTSAFNSNANLTFDGNLNLKGNAPLRLYTTSGANYGFIRNDGTTTANSMGFYANGRVFSIDDSYNAYFYNSGSTENARFTNAGNFLLGVTSETGLSSGGDFALKNGASIRFRNAANSAYLNMINVDSSNNLNFGLGGVPTAITFSIGGIGESGRFSSAGNFLLGTNSASGAKMDLAFSTTQNGLVIAPTSFVYPTYSLLTTNGVIGTVKSGSGTVRLVDIRATEATSVANGQVIGGYFQIDNANAAVNANGGQIGIYGLVNGVSNYTVGHQYGVYGRSGSGGTYGIGVMAVLGADVTLGYRAALVALTNNTTDRIASFQNSGGEYAQFNGLGSLGLQIVPNRWFSNRSVIQMGSSVSAISGANGYEFGLNFYVAETTALDKRVQTGYANKMYSDAAVGDILWATAGTGAGDSNISWGEKMRLTNGGSFLIGTSTANNATFAVNAVPNGTVGNQAAFIAGSKSAYASIAQLPQGQLFVYDNTGPYAGTGGAISFGGDSGGGQQTWYAAIEARKDNATSGDYGGAMVFYTRPTGATAGERMRITSAGDVNIYNGNSFNCYNPGNARYGSFYTNSNGTVLTSWNGAGEPLTLNAPTGYMTFNTNGSERARFTSGGNFWFGTTNGAAFFGSAFVVAKNGSDVMGIVNSSGNSGETILSMKGGANGSDSTSTYIVFQRSDGVERGSIRATGTTSVVYNTSSDYRLKTVVGPVTDAGSRLDALEPIEFLWNEDGSTDRGFLAHKFKEVYSRSVSGEKDEVDKNGKPKYQSMQASTAEVIADLVSEIQSLRKRLAAANL